MFEKKSLEYSLFNVIQIKTLNAREQYIWLNAKLPQLDIELFYLYE